jgi:hypothetical protein
MAGTEVSGSFSVAGISLKADNEVTLLFGYGNEPTIEQRIHIDAAGRQPTQGVDLEKIWAQKKLAFLELNQTKNADEIEVLGKRYGLITPNTSLIVLENLSDYIAYEVTPPAELRAEYDRIIKQQGQERLAQKRNNWTQVDAYYSELAQWWSSNIRFNGAKRPVGKHRASKGLVDEEDLESHIVGAVAQMDTLVREVSADPNVRNKVTEDERTALKADEAGAPRERKKTAVKATTWNPDRTYLKALAAAPAAERYALYLTLREEQEGNPAYYFDVAHFFYNAGDRRTALLILSNIADLGLENHQLYKTLTYTLREWAAYEDAAYTAGEIVKWRAHEPQSHRDYALALEDTRQYQEALDELIAALDVNYYGEMSGQYAGVEDIILMDLNRLVAEHPELNTGKLDKKYLKKMPVAVRVILNWNQMDTDLDMHVTEPTGEECYYGHRETEAGARFSKDFTQGYGPEQYLLRNPLKGKYQIKTNYYGEQQLTESGPATVLVEIYTRKADGRTERRLKTMQLGAVKENGVIAEVLL